MQIFTNLITFLLCFYISLYLEEGSKLIYAFFLIYWEYFFLSPLLWRFYEFDFWHVNFDFVIMESFLTLRTFFYETTFFFFGYNFMKLHFFMKLPYN